MRAEILAQIAAKIEPKIIAAELSVSYATVLRYKKEFDKAKLDNTLNDLLDFANADELNTVIAAMHDNDPLLQATDATTLSNGVQGLQRLDEELQRTALHINQKLRSLSLSTDSIGDLKVITDSVCALHTAFINSNKTQINVQQNFGADGEPKYGEFLSDKPPHL